MPNRPSNATVCGCQVSRLFGTDGIRGSAGQYPSILQRCGGWAPRSFALPQSTGLAPSD